jgi:hypothetical protein
LSSQKGVEALDRRELNGMLTKELDSSGKVFTISNDTSLRIGIKKSAQAMIVATVSQDVERNSALSLIVGLLHILLLEEVSHILISHSKDVLIRELRHFSIVVKLRSIDFSKISLKRIKVRWWIHILFNKIEIDL